MKKIKKKWILALFLALFPLLTSQGEEGSWYFGWRLLYDQKPLRKSAVLDHCYPMNYGECNYDSRIQKDFCRLTQQKNLGSVEGRELTFLKYNHEIVYADGGNPWSCKTEEVLITETTGEEGSVQPVFADASEEDFASVTGAELVDHPKGPFLTVHYCANGTGGCTQLAFIRRDGKWQELQKDITWNAVYKQLPGRYVPHKSPYIDFKTLTWEQHLVTDNDPNCCPSGRILFDLDVIDSKLSVKNFKIETGEAFWRSQNKLSR